MKISTFLTGFMMAALLLMAANLFATDYVVSGSGIAAVNGTYTRVGSSAYSSDLYQNENDVYLFDWQNNGDWFFGNNYDLYNSDDQYYEGWGSNPDEVSEWWDSDTYATVTCNVEIAPNEEAPTLTTTSISTFDATSATLGGNISDDGGASVNERGVVYSSSDNTPTIGEAGVTKDIIGSGTGSFSESITSLTVIATYYVQAYATNSQGTSYGGVETFTTTAHFNGSGTTSNPYEIQNLDDLRALSEYPVYWDKHFIQTANIDASATSGWNGGDGFSPIGQYTDSEFTGSYDGQNNNIENLYINRPDEINVGLFGFVTSSATISNVEMIGGSITGKDDVGALIGEIDNSTVTDCSSTANVTCSGNDSGETAGGLIGNFEQSFIINSYATGSVTGSKFSGGLIGAAITGSIDNCYAGGTVETTLNGYAGGLIGDNDDASISNSHATGDVSGQSNVGGLLGDNEAPVTNCYATGQVTATGDDVGGLIGDHDVSDNRLLCNRQC